ncbi:MAG: TlpA family protein disulfide reductase [Deltaproteobacteria bacterium]|nr:TlpA family protein disulfide reductase [Deltaproteobacteria bacterium]
MISLKGSRGFLRILCVTVLVFTVFGLGGCSKSSEKEKEPGARGMLPNEGDQVKPFKARTLSGGEFDTGSLKGKPFVINFFASWCGPCRYEAPGLEKLYVIFKDKGVEFVGVAVQDSDDGVRKFMDNYGISYPLVMDDSGDISHQYAIYALPKTFVVGKDGKITYIRSGAVSEEELAVEIRRVL